MGKFNLETLLRVILSIQKNSKKNRLYVEIKT